MKLAHIYAVKDATATGSGFVWRWRSVKGKEESAGFFKFFYDCLEDARNLGYTAETPGVPEGLDQVDFTSRLR